MSTGYRLFIASEVISLLRTFRRSDQDRITRCFDDLLKDPFHSGDFIEPDEIGRPIHVRILGRFAIFYWVDHPVKEIKVTDLRPAGS